jgi:quinohemoprotein amine dehydrogenase beta subunit
LNPRVFVCLALLVALSSCAKHPSQQTLHDYLVTAAKPDRLFVIDPATQTVKAEYRIPDANGIVGLIVPSPDGRIVYVLVNKMESIAGIDLTTGQMVFRADLSSPGERVKTMFAFDVTPDGRELIVHELPTRLEPSDYRVEEPRFAVFSTAAGLAAKPVRQFPAPRRVHMVLAKKNGRTFYALGFELYEFDGQSGRLIAQQAIRSWQLPNHSVPDMLAVWPVSEPTGVFSTPVYSTVTTPGGPASGVAKTSLMTLDLHTGLLAYNDFEDTAALIFSTVMSPARAEAFGVYTQLTKINTQDHVLANRINLDHTFYSVNISSDGKIVYLGGAMCDVASYDASTLERRGNIRLPGCPDQALATLRVIRR